MVNQWLIDAVRAAGLTESGRINLEIGDKPIDKAWAAVGAAFDISADQLAEHVAAHFGIQVADLETAEPEARKLVPERFANRHKILALREEGDVVVIASPDPGNYDIEHSIAFATGRPLVFEVAAPDAIRETSRDGSSIGEVETLLSGVDTAVIDAITVMEEIRPEEVEHHEIQETPVIKLANLILFEAIRRRASDIHIGPGPGGGTVRFRIDGVLNDYMEMPLGALNRIISRIKILGRLDITDRLRPQDGRTRIQVNDRQYDLRISTVPTRDSENAVIRILDPNTTMSFKDLGMPLHELEQFRKLLSYRNGIIIVTGPTGSGKTTTLYAGIREIGTGDTNIMTVEDPVEYELPGVTQIQVEPARNVTFASALRAILRQDPDVIFVGEIRDLETAQVAVQASSTGHLVLATLHTNDAMGIVPRLTDLGLDLFSIGSSLRGALAQRLLRSVCRKCSEKIEGELTEDEKALAKRYGCRPVVRVHGCDYCLLTGYRGRLPVMEVFEVDPRMSELISRGANTVELGELATRNGMRGMLACGLERVRAGETTLDEIARVLGESNEEGVAEDEIPESRDDALSADSDVSAGESAKAKAGPQERDPRDPRDPNDESEPEAEQETAIEAADDEVETGEGAVAAAVEAPAEPAMLEAPPTRTPAPAADDGDDECLAEPPVLPTPRVLVVDDDPQMRRFVRALLEHNDLDVVEARNGELALEVVKNEGPFSLVVLDLHMPKLGGQEVLSVLRGTPDTANVPIVVLTAANGTSEVETFDLGADDYIEKPIEPARFIARVNATLRRASA